MRLVVVGVDGSEQSRRALQWALPYASLIGTGVEAIMTVAPTDDAAETHATERAAAVELESFVEDVLSSVDDPPPVSYEVVAGDPAVVLVNASRGAELVVLGSHGMSTISNPALGSVSTACIRMGSCPVLVIQAGNPEPLDDEEQITPR